MDLGRLGKMRIPDLLQKAQAALPVTAPAPVPDLVAGLAAGAAAAARKLPPLLPLSPVAERLQTRLARVLPPAGPSTGKIGWVKGADAAPKKDATAQFNAAYAAARSGDRTLPPGAKDHVYLLVPGLFTKRYPGYMNDNERRLKDLGLDARRVPVDTDASVEANAKVVRAAILEAARSGKKVVLLGHSKGGVDAAAALALYPELKPHVRSVVALQAPYGGSPLATDLQAEGPVKGAVDRVVRTIFRGDPRALGDLTHDARRAFVTKHPYPTDVPTISVATTAGAAPSAVGPAVAYLQTRYGARSDGLVAAEDAEIPGSSVVRLDGLDHACPVMVGPTTPFGYRPADVTQALVALALRS